MSMLRQFHWAIAGCFVFVAMSTVSVACQPAGADTPSASPSAQLPVATTSASRSDPSITLVPPFDTVSALERIRQTGLVRVGVLYNLPPFGFLADNGELSGFEVELVRQIAEHWGVEVAFIQVTRQTRLTMLYDGEIDFIAAAMPHSRELEQFVEFSDTTFLSGYVVLVRGGQGIDSLLDLSGFTVGAIGDAANAALSEYAGRAGIGVTVQTYGSLDEGLAALAQAGGPMALVGRREQMLLGARTVPNTEVLEEFVRMEPIAFAMRNGDTPLRDLLNLSLQQIAVAGEYGGLFASNFYNTAPDSVSRYGGESAYTFADFPATLSTVESVTARVERGEPLRVAGLALVDQPSPFDGQQVIDGYNRAVINEFARRWGVSVQEIADSSGEAGLSRLRAGQADIAVGVRPDLGQLGHLAYSLPYYQRGLRLIHLQGTALLGINDLEFKAVIPTEPLTVSQDLIQDNNGFAQIVAAGTNEEAFQSLVSGAVYAIVGDEYSMMLMGQGDTRIAAVGGVYRSEDYAVAIPSGDVQLLALVNITLQDMKLDGTLDALRAQYLGPYRPADDQLSPFQLEIWPESVDDAGS